MIEICSAKHCISKKRRFLAASFFGLEIKMKKEKSN